MKINTQSQPSDNWVSQEMTASTGSYVAFLGPHQQTEGGGFMEERSPGPEERFESSFLRLRCHETSAELARPLTPDRGRPACLGWTALNHARTPLAPV